ncbi:MAG TPA: hypothetical protein VGJ41_18815 [Nocardioides sp.]|jgi:hypothetical protein
MNRLLREVTPSQWLARTLVTLAAPAVLLCSLPAGGSPSVALFVLVLGLSLAAAVMTDSPFGLAAFVLAVYAWGTGVPDPMSPWVLAATAALVTGHVAGLLADHGPHTLDLGPALGRRWLIRGALVFAAAPLAWLVVRVVDDAPAQPRIWVAGLVVCLGGVLATAVALRLSPGDS